jgi:hypothetical protein
LKIKHRVLKLRQHSSEVDDIVFAQCVCAGSTNVYETALYTSHTILVCMGHACCRNYLYTIDKIESTAATINDTGLNYISDTEFRQVNLEICFR